MEVFLIKQPAEISFTGNPMPYAIGISPYGALEQSQNLIISVTVHIEILLDSNAFSDVKTQNFYPDNKGIINFDVKTIVDAYLEYYTPPPDLNKPAQAFNQRKRFRISYILQKDGQPVTDVKYSEPLVGIKGGMSFSEWHPYNFFEQVVLQQRRPLNYFAAGEKVRLDDVRYLFWLYPFEDNNDQQVFVIMTLDDGSVISYPLPNKIFSNRWGICCSPVGFNALKLYEHVPDGHQAVYYTVTVATNSVTIVESVKYQLDYRQFYEPYQLIYRNSLGGMDTISLTGQVDLQADYVRQQAQRVVPPSYFESGNIIYAKALQSDIEEQPKIQAATGFLNKNTADKLRDLFLSKQVYEYHNGKFVPVILNNRNTKFYSNRDKTLISIELEWLRPVNSYYTPNYLMKGLSIATCPGVEYLRLVKTASFSLQIWWGLRTPYDKVEVEIVIPTRDIVPPYAEGEKVMNYKLTGNTGTQIFAYSVFQLGLFAIAAFHQGTITARARTICDENSDPPSLGPWLTVPMSNPDNLPVATNDTYSINGGYNTAQILTGSVMDNDYDSNSDPIEVVTASGATTQGGAYAINSQGIITYTPPSSAFTGADTFTYALRKVGGTDTVSATVTINVASAPNIEQFYVKQVYRNVTTWQQGRGKFTSGEIWLEFYKNAAGTIPHAIPSPGKNIPYKIVTTEKRSATPTTQSEENFNPVVVSTNQLKVFQGLYYEKQSATPYLNPESFTVEVQVQPTNYYTVI